MKIDRIQTFHVRHQLEEPFAYSQLTVRSRNALLIEITLDDGSSGWGECYGPSELYQAAVRHYYGPLLLGTNPLETDQHWHHMWQQTLDFARRGIMMGAISGLDMALWDLKGQVLGRPASELMGGRRLEQIPCYATGMYFQDRPEPELIDSLVEEAAHYLEQGFAGVKVKIGKNPTFDIALVTRVREAFPEALLLSDANHAYDLPEAERVGRVLQELNYGWFEEPLSPEHPHLYRQLQEKLSLPLATGECEQTRWGFQSLLQAGGVQIAQPDLAYCGGLSEGLKIRTLASSLGINVIPHVWGTMVNMASAVHFQSSGYGEPGRAEAQLPLLECDRSPNALRDALFQTPIEIHNGFAAVPSSPGLGVVVDRQALESYCVSHDDSSGW